MESMIAVFVSAAHSARAERYEVMAQIRLAYQEGLSPFHIVDLKKQVHRLLSMEKAALLQAEELRNERHRV